MRLAMRSLLRTIPSPVIPQELFPASLVKLGILQTFVQNSIALVAKEKVVGRQWTERRKAFALAKGGIGQVFQFLWLAGR